MNMSMTTFVHDDGSYVFTYAMGQEAKLEVTAKIESLTLVFADARALNTERNIAAYKTVCRNLTRMESKSVTFGR